MSMAERRANPFSERKWLIYTGNNLVFKVYVAVFKAQKFVSYLKILLVHVWRKCCTSSHFYSNLALSCIGFWYAIPNKLFPWTKWGSRWGWCVHDNLEYSILSGLKQVMHSWFANLSYIYTKFSRNTLGFSHNNLFFRWWSHLLSMAFSSTFILISQRINECIFFTFLFIFFFFLFL